MEYARNLIKKNEGLRLKPYVCPAGKITIGYGRNLTDNGISIDEAREMFENDLIAAKITVGAIFGIEIFNESPARVAALIDMAFNLGESRMRKFVKFIDAVKRRDWQKAAQEMRNSLWYKQVTKRAEFDAKLIEGGELIEFVAERK